MLCFYTYVGVHCSCGAVSQGSKFSIRIIIVHRLETSPVMRNLGREETPMHFCKKKQSKTGWWEGLGMSYMHTVITCNLRFRIMPETMTLSSPSGHHCRVRVLANPLYAHLVADSSQSPKH